MRLIQLTGNQRSHRARSKQFVISIVDFLIRHQETRIVVAEVLQTIVQRAQPELTEKLEGLQKLYRYIDEEGNYKIPEHILYITQILERFYRQNNSEIEDQRGAIVELLGHKLVCLRYKTDDICINSGGFIDEQGKPITIQELDVAALSDRSKLVEAYECKMRVNKLESHDCTDLEYLAKAAEARNYRSNIGIISFDEDRVVNKKLMRLRASEQVNAYGIESIVDLQASPF